MFSQLLLARISKKKHHIYGISFSCSRCEKITSAGVSEIVCHCPSLEILRCGYGFQVPTNCVHNIRVNQSQICAFMTLPPIPFLMSQVYEHLGVIHTCY